MIKLEYEFTFDLVELNNESGMQDQFKSIPAVSYGTIEASLKEESEMFSVLFQNHNDIRLVIKGDQIDSLIEQTFALQLELKNIEGEVNTIVPVDVKIAVMDSRISEMIATNQTESEVSVTEPNNEDIVTSNNTGALNEET